MTTIFKNKDFRKMSLATILSTGGDTLFYLALITYASTLKEYTFIISLISIFESLPTLLSFYLGYKADQTESKLNHVVMHSFFRGGLYLLVGLLFLSDINTYHMVLIIIFINLVSDISGVYCSGLISPIIQEMFAEEELDEAVGATNGINQVVRMAAQFIGVSLLLFISYNLLSYINAFSFILAGLIFHNLSLSWKKVSFPSDPPLLERFDKSNQQGILSTLKTSICQIKEEPNLFSMVFKIAGLNGILACLSPLLEIILVSKSEFIIVSYTLTIAIVGTCITIGLFLGGIVGVKLLKSVSLEVLITWFSGISTVFFISLKLSNVYLILCLLGLIGFLAGTCSPKLTGWLMSSVERQIVASSVGIINTIMTIISPVMLVIITTIINLFSLNRALSVLTIASLILFVTSCLTKIKRLWLLKEAVHKK